MASPLSMRKRLIKDQILDETTNTESNIENIHNSDVLYRSIASMRNLRVCICTWNGNQKTLNIQICNTEYLIGYFLHLSVNGRNPDTCDELFKGLSFVTSDIPDISDICVFGCALALNTAFRFLIKAKPFSSRLPLNFIKLKISGN